MTAMRCVDCCSPAAPPLSSPTDPVARPCTHSIPWPYKRRNLVERTFCRIKDFRRVATRYDKLAATYAAAISLAAIIAWWI